METTLITGGANGIGKGLAMHYLDEGDQVIAVGNSAANGDAFYNEATVIGAENRVVFMRADLSLIGENQRIIKEIYNTVPTLDKLIFCASKHSKQYTETADGLELTFTLDYLSRFILSYGLKGCMEKSGAPVIMNICGTGMKGVVNWDDLQHKNSFDALKVMMHGSRLNDLSGTAFVRNDTVKKIKYILYNPMAVQTPGMLGSSNTSMKLMYKFIGKPIEKAILPIIELLDNPPISSLSAYKEYKELSLALTTYNEENAMRLYNVTTKLLECRRTG